MLRWNFKLKIFSTLCLVSGLVVAAGSRSGDSSFLRKKPVIGDAQIVLGKFEAAGQKKLASTDAQTLTLGLGFIKGLSTELSKGRGTIAFDLANGTYSLSLSRFEAGVYRLSLLENSASGTSLGPDSSDRFITLTTLDLRETRLAESQDPLVFTGVLPEELKGQFKLDFVVISEETEPVHLLFASPKLFDKWYFQTLKSDLPWSSFLRELAIGPVSAEETPLEALVAEGEQLFLEGTFEGNGRTCGTCHRPENNFTIDAAFIATLPLSDPLFVAETNPQLAQLEKPVLMRQFGLILENVDGLSDPTNKFVMRSVPHTLGLPTSLLQDAAIPNAPAEMLGWSGDGSAGNGSLREFAIGAVTQHATRSLNRIEGVDFRLPNDAELDAMEAFQLSLGRQADIDLAAVTFRDAIVTQGQNLFINGNGNPNAGGKCQTCHANAGANAAATGTNRNFNTGVEEALHPARAVQNFPRDGGFGPTPDGLGGFGDGRFNTTPLIEAADTGPFFHNNLVNTIEQAVAFYNTDAFNATRAPAARINLTTAEINAVAGLLRVLNTLDNMKQATAYANRAISTPAAPDALAIKLAVEETNDAVASLSAVPILPPTKVQLNKARDNFVLASTESNPEKQVKELDKGIKALVKVREQLLVE